MSELLGSYRMMLQDAPEAVTMKKDGGMDAMFAFAGYHQLQVITFHILRHR